MSDPPPILTVDGGTETPPLEGAAMTTFVPRSGRSARIDDAIEWIEVLFAGATSKGDGRRPYTAHLYTVADIVDRYGGDEDQIIAALLHDVVEDKGGAARLPEIEDRYGEVVAGIVDACTDSWVQEPADKERWWPRKVRYVRHIADAPDPAVLVCAADKFANAASTRDDFARHGDKAFRVFDGGSGRDGQLWYYRRVVEELARREVDTGGLVADLVALVDSWVVEVEAGTSGPPLAGLYEAWCAAEADAAPTVGPAPERPTPRRRP